MLRATAAVSLLIMPPLFCLRLENSVNQIRSLLSGVEYHRRADRRRLRNRSSLQGLKPANALTSCSYSTRCFQMREEMASARGRNRRLMMPESRPGERCGDRFPQIGSFFHKIVTLLGGREGPGRGGGCVFFGGGVVSGAPYCLSLRVVIPACNLLVNVTMYIFFALLVRSGSFSR